MMIVVCFANKMIVVAMTHGSSTSSCGCGRSGVEHRLVVIAWVCVCDGVGTGRWGGITLTVQGGNRAG